MGVKYVTRSSHGNVQTAPPRFRFTFDRTGNLDHLNQLVMELVDKTSTQQWSPDLVQFVHVNLLWAKIQPFIGRGLHKEMTRPMFYGALKSIAFQPERAERKNSIIRSTGKALPLCVTKLPEMKAGRIPNNTTCELDFSKFDLALLGKLLNEKNEEWTTLDIEQCLPIFQFCREFTGSVTAVVEHEGKRVDISRVAGLDADNLAPGVKHWEIHSILRTPLGEHVLPNPTRLPPYYIPAIFEE